MDVFDGQAEWTRDIMQASVAFWSPLVSAPVRPAWRSWYRAPAPNPFDLGTWAVPAAFMPFAAPYMPQWSNAWIAFSGSAATYQIPWSAIASVASAMAAMQPAQSGWSAYAPTTHYPAAAWSAALWPWVQHFNTYAATASTAFSNYQSDSGHAVAHIVYAPTPTNAPAMPFFGWPSFTLH